MTVKDFQINSLIMSETKHLKINPTPQIFRSVLIKIDQSISCSAAKRTSVISLAKGECRLAREL